MSLAETRFDQLFPVFDSVQVETAKRFASGAARHFASGEPIYDVGQRNIPSWMVLDGSLEIVRRDGLHRQSSVVSLGAGQFSGEVSQLAGRGTLAAAQGGPDGCTALPFDAAHIRALVIGSADVGEIVMRAFILRRVSLIQEGGVGSLLIGPSSPDLIRLEGFLARNAYPYTVLNVVSDEEARTAVERFGVHPDEMPIMICPNGALLKRPSDAEAAACLGITPELDAKTIYDVAVVGAGPAGLATAVYGASEGLSVIVLDQRAYGGQAGASSRIENYLGFPTGISGQALAGRAFTQAQKFGAEVAIPLEAVKLDCGASQAGRPFRIEISNGQSVQARTVVIASGARYRRPDIANLSDFDGAGISYWASQIEARLCEGEEVALIGGGNSAGQAVVFLAPKVKRLHLVARRKLEATMSRYLIDRIGALPNVELHIGSEVVALEGDRNSGLNAVTFRDRDSGATVTHPLRHLFLFIGADPNADWLANCVAVDGKGFVLTGDKFAGGGAGRAPLPLETSMPGVFAIGDVRASSTKRVGAAIGEGAAVVAQIHAVLALGLDKMKRAAN
jgi:thioredoxin reductase (NADPH)